MFKLFVPFRIHSAGWLVIVLCFLVGVRVAGWGLALPFGFLLILSLLLHEAGHMLAAKIFSVQVHEFGLCLAGAYNRRAHANRRRDEILISVAGPMMNLCLVIPFLFVPRIGALLAVCNLELCVFNLLPLPSSDGLRILRTIWPRPQVNLAPTSAILQLQ